MTERSVRSSFPSHEFPVNNSGVDEFSNYGNIAALRGAAITETETSNTERTVRCDIAERSTEHAGNRSVGRRDSEQWELGSKMSPEKEYVLLEFVAGWVPAPNTPFSLSGLDTLNPILEFADGTKMIGHYEETIGTCILFSEDEKDIAMREEAKSKTPKKGGVATEPNPLYIRTFANDDASNQDEYKAPQPFCSLQKKLIFFPFENDSEKKDIM